MRRDRLHLVSLTLILLLGCPPGPAEETAPPGDSADSDQPTAPAYAILAWPNRAMNPMDPSYATASLRPPGVSIQAQVVARGAEPTLPQTGLTLRYAAQDSTAVAGATDFWEHAPVLLGDTAPAQGQGLTGLGLDGQLELVGGNYRAASIPVVPTTGTGHEGPFPLFDLMLVDSEDQPLADGLVVAPSSWDLGCTLCHGEDYALDVLVQHDARHETTHVDETPVRCGSCHAQPELGWPGNGEAPVLAAALHHAHAERVDELEGKLTITCLACHPGPDTPFYRGSHTRRDTTCTDCHGTMAELVAEGRNPWRDLPRCSDCHQNPGIDYEQAGVAYRDSVGHGGLRCPACHHAPHGLYGSELDADNAQNIELQGYAGVISTCRVCHDPIPSVQFPHMWDGE